MQSTLAPLPPSGIVPRAHKYYSDRLSFSQPPRVQVWGVCFDPKRDRFCSVSEDKTLRIFEPAQTNPAKPAPTAAA